MSQADVEAGAAREPRRAGRNAGQGAASDGRPEPRPTKQRLSDRNVRADGRYLRFNGKELCFAWNRSKNGCRTPCAAKQTREH
eukprot:11710812-Karenia_brevis.AAC.1